MVTYIVPKYIFRTLPSLEVLAYLSCFSYLRCLSKQAPQVSQEEVVEKYKGLHQTVYQ